MQVLEQWSGLVRAALLGTERAGTQLHALENLTKVADASPEQQLLSGFAQLSVLMRAGYTPPQQELTAEIAPADVKVNASARAFAALTSLLVNHHASLLVDWCEHAARAGRKVPVHLLPELLQSLETWPTAKRTVHSALQRAGLNAILGARGCWLARQNAEWNTLLASADESAQWETGNAEQRTCALQIVRAKDSAQARTLLQAARSQESPDTFAAFVALLGDGLSMDDEPFLEDLLDAKHKPVRSAAADLLGRLPQSRYCLRMRDRLMPLIQAHAARGVLFKKKAQLEIALPPESVDKAWQRDGIDGKRKTADLGPRAFALAQLVAATPLPALAAHCQMTPAEFLAAAKDTDEAASLIYGVALAVLAQSDPQWCDALLDVLAKRQQHQYAAVVLEDEARLISLLEPKARESALRQRGELLPLVWWSHLLICAEHAWSEPFSDWIIESMLSTVNHYGWYARATAETLALRLHPHSARKAIERAHQMKVDVPAQWLELVRLIELRLNYVQEFSV